MVFLWLNQFLKDYFKNSFENFKVSCSPNISLLYFLAVGKFEVYDCYRVGVFARYSTMMHN